MTNKVLVAYATNAGTTAEVAEAIGKALEQNGAAVDTRLIAQVKDLSKYDMAVVGAPVILGWHREATNFVAQNQAALSQKRVAYFFTALNLTQTGEEHINGTPIALDPQTAKAPRKPGRLNFKENYATPGNYLAPVLKKAPAVKPLHAGFFGGALDYGKLNLLQQLFVRFLIQAQAGDYRNWDFIHTWAQNLIGAS
ncbi:MAG: flavodoxin domain-containing protein [Anaerolineae bacterium]|nr:flavodoxin domain-containing protein [Anaerolineae bacterium]